MTVLSLVFSTILLSSFVIIGVWAVSSPEQILSWIKTKPILSSKVISGTCPCPASFYSPLIYSFIAVSEYPLFIRGHMHFIDSYELFIENWWPMLQMFAGLPMSMLGTAAVLYVVGKWLDLADAKMLESWNEK